MMDEGGPPAHHENAPVTLLLCATCTGGDRSADLEAVKVALAKQGLTTQVHLESVDCMGACEAPVSLGLQGVGRASYVFAGVQPLLDAQDIARTCQTYLDAPAGWIEDARPCGRLRDCLRARLPALRATAD
jgi:predicted metal-binding protein